jgi:endo-1,4-beta-xylanase
VITDFSAPILQEFAMKRKEAAGLLIILFVCLGTAAGGQGDLEILKKVYKDFYIGAAVSPMTINSADNLLTTHFSGVTPENIMKPEPIHPQEKVYRFQDADRLVEYAEERGMAIHGHVLVWHNQTGTWMFRDGAETASAELLETRMKEHISTVVGRYKGRIAYWDVVNEAVSDSAGIYRTDSPWFEIMGADYIEKAFRAAHEADPEARLYYNDYNVVDPVKRERIYTMVKALLEKGVPIHGIGIQGHWSINWPEISEVEKSIDLFAELGLEVKITELDISVYDFNEKEKLFTEPVPELMEKQAKKYKDLFELFLAKSDVIEGVTTWGVADDHTWLDNFPVKNRKNWPLLFDSDHEPKPAFKAVIKAGNRK